MLLLRLLSLASALILSGSAPPSWRDTARAAETAWDAAAASGDATSLPRAAALYAQAFSESGGRAHGLYWESIRVALVGCLHAALPPRASIAAELRRELALSASPENARGFTQVSQLAALTALDGAEQLLAARAWAAAFSPAGAPPPPPPRLAAPEAGVWRVGYLTSKFGEHPIGAQIGSLLRGHNRSQFRVSCWSTAESDGSARLRANRAACDEWHEWPRGAPSVPAAAAALRAARLHVLIALDGVDIGHRMEVLAQRPAPLVCTFFGYLGTLGASYVDAIIADARALPPGDEHMYAERDILRHATTFFMQDYATAHPEVAAAATAAAPVAAAANGPPPPAPFTFCAFSQLFKVSARMAEVWTRILEASPGTRLLLFDHPPVSRVGLLSAHPRLAALAAEGRVLFWAKLPHDEHLLRKRATCTLALDTESYNGHTSTADMLYAGVPVLTLALPESAMGGKAAASIVAAAGAPPFFHDARSLDVYEARARQIAVAYASAAAGDGDGGGGGGGGGAGAGLLWRPRLDAPLFDSARWVREFEAMLADYLERKLAEERGGVHLDHSGEL